MYSVHVSINDEQMSILNKLNTLNDGKEPTLYIRENNVQLPIMRELCQMGLVEINAYDLDGNGWTFAVFVSRAGRWLFNLAHVTITN